MEVSWHRLRAERETKVAFQKMKVYYVISHLHLMLRREFGNVICRTIYATTVYKKDSVLWKYNKRCIVTTTNIGGRRDTELQKEIVLGDLRLRH